MSWIPIGCRAAGSCKTRGNNATETQVLGIFGSPQLRGDVAKSRVYIRLSIREARNVERDARTEKREHKGDYFTFPESEIIYLEYEAEVSHHHVL